MPTWYQPAPSITTSESDGPTDGNASLADSVALTARLTRSDNVNAQTDSWLASLVTSFADTLTSAADAVLARVANLLDTNTAPTDSIERTSSTWANSHTASGTAPSNPTNAYGANNGSLATVKAGGVSNGTSSLTLTVPTSSIPAGTHTLRAWYRTTNGVSDTFTISYSNPGGTPSSGSLPSGDHLAAPQAVAVTTVGSSFSVTFTHQALTPATGGQIDVDAVCVLSAGGI